MFEGLKDMLGSFREDVKEEAVEEVPEDELEDAEGDAPADAPAEAEDSAEAEAATDDETGDGDAETGNGDPDTGLGRRARSLARGRFVIDEDDLEGPLRDLELALLRNDVEMEVADAILDRVREELVGETRKVTEGTTSVVEDALREALLSVLSVGQFDFEGRIADAEKPVVIVFTGVNGVGKTTTIAKVSQYLKEEGYSSVLANGDTYRAGANEQIEEHAENLGRKCIAHEQGGDPAAVI
ncbi:MAG: signal recognition particle receptor subunit alpha, partial [Halobacteriales archaeon]